MPRPFFTQFGIASLKVMQRGHQWRVQKLFQDTIVAPLNQNIEFFTSSSGSTPMWGHM